MNSNDMDDLLADGFTRRMAAEYLQTQEVERASGMFDPDYLEWAHSNGFYAESACAYQLSDQTKGNYLSDYDFCKLWPLNDWQRIWINDKLTFEYTLAGTEFSHFLPEYYYYSSKGRLLALLDSRMDVSLDGFLSLLREKGEFACKPCNGTESAGFHKLTCDADSFGIDGMPADAKGIGSFLREHPNYVFTEYLHPSQDMAEIDPLIHTLRLVVIDPTGVDPVPIASYLRFAVGNKDSQSGANYQRPTSDDICSYNVEFDIETGRYGNGKLAYATKVLDMPRHPDSGILVEGAVDAWQELLASIKRLSLRLGPVEYMGFDIGITDHGPKIMEINSHPGIKYLQIFKPLLTNELAAEYYRRKLDLIGEMTPDERTRRNETVR